MQQVEEPQTVREKGVEIDMEMIKAEVETVEVVGKTIFDIVDVHLRGQANDEESVMEQENNYEQGSRFLELREKMDRMETLKDQADQIDAERGKLQEEIKKLLTEKLPPVNPSNPFELLDLLSLMLVAKGIDTSGVTDAVKAAFASEDTDAAITALDQVREAFSSVNGGKGLGYGDSEWNDAKQVWGRFSK